MGLNLLLCEGKQESMNKYVCVYIHLLIHTYLCMTVSILLRKNCGVMINNSKMLICL